MMLDDAGLDFCKIVASNSLDEYVISEMLRDGAQIDIFGVGERLITSRSSPVLGGVYKLVATEDAAGAVTPKIKISENEGKITNPGAKRLIRLYEKGKASADLISLADEVFDFDESLEIFDPENIWKRKTLTEYEARELLIPIFRRGELVYEMPSLNDIQQYCQQEVESLWDEVKRFENPHKYYVDLSQKLWDLKQAMLHSGYVSAE
jgi:nicotinate phosphoribosyltransferase